MQVGDLVKVKPNAKWYWDARKRTIAPFVFDTLWRVVEIRGNRVVLGEDIDFKFDIQSPIHKKYLEVQNVKFMS